MTTIATVGDGPAGLSAARILPNNDLTTPEFGQYNTAMHHTDGYGYRDIGLRSGLREC